MTPYDATAWLHIAGHTMTRMTEQQCRALGRRATRPMTCIGPDGRTVTITCARAERSPWWSPPPPICTTTEEMPR